MSYQINELPDLSPLGGHWTLTTSPDDAYDDVPEYGLAHLPGVEWPYQPADCTVTEGTWYLDGTLLLCDGCGVDGT
ncbi:hypothetical protein [Nocardia jiangxiensis]|uniref:hypothetical protein n=1 Tax=Nocardia jiangxiensis TaxID=282685 RepID=UPI000313C10B|nr:hypothetical protein [Nocardia jiangxiensis]